MAVASEFDVPLVARVAAVTLLMAAMVDGTAALQLLLFLYPDLVVLAAELLEGALALALLGSGASLYHGGLKASYAGAAAGLLGGGALAVWALLAACWGFVSPLGFLAAASTLLGGALAAASIPGCRRLEAARLSAL